MMKNMNKKSICSSSGDSITLYHESMITNDMMKLNDMIIKSKVLRLRSNLLQILTVVIIYIIIIILIHIMTMILRMLIIMITRIKIMLVVVVVVVVVVVTTILVEIKFIGLSL
jgi:hypothetical protein